MTTVAIIGGTGYSGANIASKAAGRGIGVTAVSRHTPAEPLEGVSYVEGAIDDVALVGALAAEHDTVIVAIHAVDENNQPVLPQQLPQLAAAAIAGGARLGFVGGAGSSLVAEGGPKLVDAGGFPDEFKPEAETHSGVLDWLRTEAPAELDWFYISPAAGYGGYNPGEELGHYRTGGDLLVVDEAGGSFISGADFALAFVDELEKPTLHRARTTVGY